MIKAKSKMIEPSSEAAASEVFAIADNIIPIRQVSVETILNTDFTEEMDLVPHTQVKRLIIQNKTTNPVSKFFIRIGAYLDSLENFLVDLNSNYFKSIEEKKSTVHSEETDKKLRDNKAKRTARRKSDNRKRNQRSSVSLKDLDNDTMLALGSLLGLTAENAISDNREYFGNLFTDKTIHKDVVKKGDFAVLPGTNVVDPPEWIPFPAGTTGLTYTSGFGMRWGRPHKGIDISGPIGTPIITPINGMVDVMGSLSGYGKAVYIKSGDLVMEFGHLDSINVRRIGQEVKAGSVIGTLGNTGRSTGPHLHWTIRMSSAAVDPVQWTKSNPPLSSTSHFTAIPELDPLDNESEGGINYNRIMVGEAGPEFVIPMSQMPIFGQLMMEEKIKSINPYYQVPYNRFNDIGFERQSGMGTHMASGGIAAAKPFIKKHEALGAFVPGTGGGNYLADYIGEDMSESIKGTPRSKAYKPSTKLHSYIDSQNVDTIGYGTTFYDNIFSGRNAVGRGDTSTVSEMESTMGRHVKEIDEKYDEEYPMYKHLKPKQQAGIISYLYNRGPNAILTHGPSDKALGSGNIRALAELIQADIKSVGPKRRKEEADLIRSGPLQVVGPKIVGPKIVGEPSVMDYIEKFFNSGDSKQSSLNSIPDHTQMEIASETQEEFSFDNFKGEIVALYKPTVHYSDPA